MKFTYPPSISLAALPTPIQKLHRISEAWQGPQIYIKRDDLTGCVLSGNKIRKLEFSTAQALNLDSDTLITCGGIQSNHARAVAVTAAKLGLKSLLVLRGSPESAPGGNLFIDRLTGADFLFITPEKYENVNEIMSVEAQKLEDKGRKPYIIPEGASNEIGYFGYIKASQEISNQLDDLNLNINYIVTALGSGGTLGGLQLGKLIFNLEPKPIGFNVCNTAEFFKEKICKEADGLISKYDLDIKFTEDDLNIIDGYVGKGYAISSDKELELLMEVARLEGIILDPVYTCKAMFGLRDQVKKDFFKKDDKVLFIHTGGLFGLFPQIDAFSNLMD